MAYTREIYEKAQEIIDGRRNEAEEKNTAKKELFARLEPDYLKYRDEMVHSALDVIKVIGMNPEKAPEYMEKLKIRNLTAQQEIKKLLKKNNLADDYLEIHYTCPVCSDTGFYNGKLCSCHMDLLKKLAYDEAGKLSPLKFCRFEDFKLSYYDDEYVEKIKCSPRERMKNIFDSCRAYAADFEITSPSLLMYGETGLGKTHLSLSIAGEIINKGYSVLYNSAQNIMNELQKERFGKTDTNGRYEAMVLECDLLVIDDLGAEFSTQFTNSVLYNMVNTRINYGIPTIISTNLDFHGLEERYTRRVSSRIIGEYSALNFRGADVRQLKNKNNNLH